MLCLYSVFFTVVFCVYSTNASTKKNTQCKELKKELQSRRHAFSSTPKVHTNFDRIYSLMEKKGREEETLEKLEQQKNLVKNRPHDLVKVYHATAQVYYAMDKLPEAFEYYNKAIALNKLPYRNHLSVLRDMAHIYMQQNDFKTAGEIVDQLFCLEDKITGKSYMLKSTILLEKKQIKKALEMAMKAINSVSRPPESWLARAVNLHSEIGNDMMALKLLHTLTARYPEKKKYWKSLSQAYSNIDTYNKSAAALDLTHKLDKGLEKESEILRLVNLLRQEGLPFYAAALVEQSIEQKKVKSTKKNYEILGDSWREASEVANSLSAYEKAYQMASRSSKAKKDWKLPVKIGRIYFNQESWNKALKYFREALTIEGVRYPEKLHKNIGHALYNLKKCQEAKLSFEKVIITPKAGSQSIKEARGAIDYISEHCLDPVAKATKNSF